ADVHAALALRALLMRDDGDPGLLRKPHVRRRQEGLQHEHGVRALKAFARPEEAAQGRGRVAQETLSRGQIEQPVPQRPKAACALVKGDAMPADAPFHARRPMVAQVLADTGQIMANLDAKALEALPLTDAGKLQELR